jgi:predicted acetyltransferase
MVAKLTRLLCPSIAELPAYLAALERGWSPDTIETAKTAKLHLQKISDDPHKFVASLDDREATGDPVTLPDGSIIRRIPGFVRWINDGEFSGAINFRWQLGTVELPPHVLGHIGYSIVPWKRRQGHATRALALLLPEVRDLGLPHIDLTTDADNLASQMVILNCGGKLVEHFQKSAAYGGKPALRYRITL